MEIKLTLSLPRDQLSVPVVRRVLAGAMSTLGVAREVIDDIQLALTEAVTNVLDHADDADDYEVSAGIHGDACVIEVIDRGAGFDHSMQGLADAENDAESGRGIQLMRALVDRVTFTQRATVGTVVHLEKAIRWDPDSLARQLDGIAEPAHGPWTDGEQLDAAPAP